MTARNYICFVCDSCEEETEPFLDFKEALENLKSLGWRSVFDPGSEEWSHYCENCKEDSY